MYIYTYIYVFVYYDFMIAAEVSFSIVRNAKGDPQAREQTSTQ